MTIMKKDRLRIEAARGRVTEEIHGNAASGGMYARGLAAEGYAGGYRDALDDVLLLLDGAQPRTRNYWLAAACEEDLG